MRRTQFILLTDELAIRRALREMTACRAQLEAELDTLHRNVERTKFFIEADSRHEHWGKNPERGWSWGDPPAA
jgi:hypothetical protein